MSTFRLSRVGLSVFAALTLGTTSVAWSADSATESTKSADTNKTEVITVHGSQVDLGGEYEGGQVARASRAGLLGNVDMMDAPFSSTSYTSKLIADQQAKSVADVLQNDPTVRTTRGYDNFSEIYMVRGLPVFSDDMLVNGVYGILPRQYVAAEMLERVEVFRGANTALNGAATGESAIGGSVNVVPKRAGSKPLTRVTLGTETGGQGYAALDFGRRFGDNQENGLRINVVGRDGETSVENQDRKLGMMSIDFDHQGDRFRFSADLSYQDHHIDSPRESVNLSGASVPSAANASSNYEQDWTYTDDKQLFGAVRGEYDLSDTTTTWLGLGGRHGKEHNLYAILGVDGDGNATYAMPYENIREDTVFSGDAGIRHEFSTGPIYHSLALSGSYYTMVSKQAYGYSYLTDINNKSIYNDQSISSDIATVFGDMDNPKKYLDYNLSGISLADTLSFWDDQISVTLGGRYQTINQKTSSNWDGVMDVTYDKSAFAPFVGAVYRATDTISIYSNYAEALTPGKTVTSSYSNRGKVLDPYISRQVEVGAKYDNSLYGGSVSLYRTKKAGQLVDGDNNLTQGGRQINQGIELSAFGKPLNSVKLLGGVTFTSAKLDKTDDSTEGNRVIGVPKVQANLNIEWKTPFIKGLTLEQRTIYTGSQYADASNELEVSSWTRIDLGARYKMTVDEKPLTLRVRVENVADKDYWASAGGYPGFGYLTLGNPRTFIVSASYDF